MHLLLGYFTLPNAALIQVNATSILTSAVANTAAHPSQAAQAHVHCALVVRPQASRYPLDTIILPHSRAQACARSWGRRACVQHSSGVQLHARLSQKYC